MDPPANSQVLVHGAFDYLREVKMALERSGIAAWIEPWPNTTREDLRSDGSDSGVPRSIRARLVVADQDFAKATAIHEAHLDSMVATNGLPRVNAVSEPDAEAASCPACNARFSAVD